MPLGVPKQIQPEKNPFFSPKFSTSAFEAQTFKAAL